MKEWGHNLSNASRLEIKMPPVFKLVKNERKGIQYDRGKFDELQAALMTSINGLYLSEKIWNYFIGKTKMGNGPVPNVATRYRDLSLKPNKPQDALIELTKLPRGATAEEKVNFVPTLTENSLAAVMDHEKEIILYRQNKKKWKKLPLAPPGTDLTVTVNDYVDSSSGEGVYFTQVDKKIGSELCRYLGSDMMLEPKIQPLVEISNRINLKGSELWSVLASLHTGTGERALDDLATQWENLKCLGNEGLYEYLIKLKKLVIRFNIQKDPKTESEIDRKMKNDLKKDLCKQGYKMLEKQIEYASALGISIPKGLVLIDKLITIIYEKQTKNAQALVKTPSKPHDSSGLNQTEVGKNHPPFLSRTSGQVSPPCSFWVRFGDCKKGSECGYSHSTPDQGSRWREPYQIDSGSSQRTRFTPYPSSGRSGNFIPSTRGGQVFRPPTRGRPLLEKSITSNFSSRGGLGVSRSRGGIALSNGNRGGGIKRGHGSRGGQVRPPGVCYTCGDPSHRSFECPKSQASMNNVAQSYDWQRSNEFDDYDQQIEAMSTIEEGEADHAHYETRHEDYTDVQDEEYGMESVGTVSANNTAWAHGDDENEVKWPSRVSHQGGGITPVSFSYMIQVSGVSEQSPVHESPLECIVGKQAIGYAMSMHEECVEEEYLCDSGASFNICPSTKNAIEVWDRTTHIKLPDGSSHTATQMCRKLVDAYVGGKYMGKVSMVFIVWEKVHMHIISEHELTDQGKNRIITENNRVFVMTVSVQGQCLVKMEGYWCTSRNLYFFPTVIALAAKTQREDVPWQGAQVIFNTTA